MVFPGETPPPPLPPDGLTAAQDALGYLNFASGKPDSRFQSQLNHLQKLVGGPHPWQRLHQTLSTALADFHTQQLPAFTQIEQAQQLLTLVFEHVAPTYRTFHRDLLFHLTDELFELPFMLARLFEATLKQGPPWTDTERIVQGALAQLNDFVGHRPVAVLENGQQMHPYAHEWFRPLPLYIAGVGTCLSPYQHILERALQHLKDTPPAVLEEAHFQMDQLDEIALDPRAYDHQHPVFKRTNYMFGEWDPHCIDNKGHYRRFVLRSIVLDALRNWMASVKQLPQEEVLYEAAAVLCGTMLMASTISGSGPNTYDSTVSLGTLLSKVARQRDSFYSRLLDTVSGPQADRLRKEAQQTKQPFGKVRQFLNLSVAQHGSHQVQHAQLAYLYSRMGYPEDARQHALVIPALSIRFETEIEWRISAGHLRLDRNQLEEAVGLLPEIEDLVLRGIECGALVDPWNILGFQGNFPLFHAREDAVVDPRVERLLTTVEDIFALASRLMSEAAADGQKALREQVSHLYRRMAEWWDRFASSTVSGLPEVNGLESFESATQVADALAEWHAAGEAAGDIGFWRQHVHRFETAKAYALVLQALLRKRDTVAAMGLLIQWLSQADLVGLESGPYSFHQLILRWLHLVLSLNPGNEESKPASPTEEAALALPRFQKVWPIIIRLFDYMEANAGDYWAVPQLDAILPRVTATPERDEETADEEDEDEEGDDGLFDAAYENVVFKDSTKDGVEGSIMDSGGGRTTFDTDLDLLTQQLDSRLKFQVTLARLWEVAAATYASVKIQAARGQASSTPDAATVSPVTEAVLDEQQIDAVRRWYERTEQIQQDLLKLMHTLRQLELAKPSGDHDSLVEFDRQLQLKFNLLSAVIYTHVSCHEAAWHLASSLPEQDPARNLPEWERHTLAIYRHILRGDVVEVRRELPQLIQTLQNIPLLYVPLDQGGDPEKILGTRTLQSVIRSLLDLLPRMGLFRESWQLLKTAQRMERFSPPGGTVITEFDRLFHSAFHAALEGLLLQVPHWPDVETDEDELVDLVGTITDHYLELWLEHSQTMRLSTLETFEDDDNWIEAKQFIEKYGAEFFHAQMLTFGNLRAILHNGISSFLDYLAENEDPLHPNKLLQDLGRTITQEQAEFFLEQIFRATVEKYDRFLEYNTTTTQSDYGEQYYALLDFLRLEVEYERQAWNLSPLVTAHEVLIHHGKISAALIWREVFETRTAEVAKPMLQQLRKLERTYGMRIPGITDLLNEKFVKPLELDRLLSFVKPAIRDARDQVVDSDALKELRSGVDHYLSTTVGSGLDVPAWLRSLDEEVEEKLQAYTQYNGQENQIDNFSLNVPVVPIPLKELKRQFETWTSPLKKPAKKRKKP